MKNYRGFTLIELLVVIAIIGILSAVVLASLNTSRAKGNDAAIQSDMNGIRIQAQIYYDNNNSSYGTNSYTESNCSATDNLFSDPTVASQIQGVETANSNAEIVCNVIADGTEYAVSSPLTASGSYYCVDSSGAATTTATALGTNTQCE